MRRLLPSPLLDHSNNVTLRRQQNQRQGRFSRHDAANRPGKPRRPARERPAQLLSSSRSLSCLCSLRREQGQCTSQWCHHTQTPPPSHRFLSAHPCVAPTAFFTRASRPLTPPPPPLPLAPGVRTPDVTWGAASGPRFSWHLKPEGHRRLPGSIPYFFGRGPRDRPVRAEGSAHRPAPRPTGSARGSRGIGPSPRPSAHGIGP